MKRVLLVFFCLFPLTAVAQQLVATHGDWRVFTATQQGAALCYLASLPVNKEGNYSKRGDVYVLVAHKSGNQDEISVSSGYPYKEGVDVVLQFGQTRHIMFAKGELAWAYDNKSDKSIVKDMIKSNDMVVRGTSWKGTFSKDTYSLKGFTDAHRHMKQECK